MPDVTTESKSSVEVSMTAKGEAQIRARVYEGEESVQYHVDDNGVPTPLEPTILQASAIATVVVERIVEVIESLERQGIKVVGRDLPQGPAE